MSEEQSLAGEKRKGNRWLKPLLEPGFYLAIAGWLCRAFYPAYSSLLWVLAIIFGVVRLGKAGAKSPREKLWFFDGIGEISVSVAGLLLFGAFTWPPWLRATIGPVNYADEPLNKVLEDLSVRAWEQGDLAYFALHEEELKVQKVTSRTTRPLRLLTILRKLTRSIGCSLHQPGFAKAASFIITLYRDHPTPREGETVWLIADGVTLRLGTSDRPERERGDEKGPAKKRDANHGPTLPDGEAGAQY